MNSVEIIAIESLPAVERLTTISARKLISEELPGRSVCVAKEAWITGGEESETYIIHIQPGFNGKLVQSWRGDSIEACLAQVRVAARGFEIQNLE